MDINSDEEINQQELPNSQPNSNQPNKLTEEKSKYKPQTLKLKQTKKHNSQTVFKYISVVIVFVFLFCFPAVFRFRNYASKHDIPTISINVLYWALGSFLLMYFGKYRFYDKVMPKVFTKLNIVSNEMTSKDIRNTYVQISKMTVDFIRYSTLSLLSLWLFSGQKWFTSLLGGSSEQYCPDLFRIFPTWPTHLQTQIEFFFGFQMGINLYDIFQLTVLKRKQFKLNNSFYQLLLHHIITSLLIILATLNLLTPSIIVLFLHDVSEVFRTSARVFILSKYQPFHNKLSIAIETVSIAAWIYTRVIVFPICVLNQIIETREIVDAPKYGIGFQYDFQTFLGLSIFAMHNFWTILLIKGAYGRYKFRVTLKNQSLKKKQ